MTDSNIGKRVATLEQGHSERRDLARSGAGVVQAPDVAAAIGGLVGELAKGSEKFDDINVSVTSETTSAGTRSTFSYRAYRHRRESQSPVRRVERTEAKMLLEHAELAVHFDCLYPGRGFEGGHGQHRFKHFSGLFRAASP
jgi:hypothetical protein